jgi:Haspin like kinase domain
LQRLKSSQNSRFVPPNPIVWAVPLTYPPLQHRDLHISNICIKPTDPSSSLGIPLILNAAMPAEALHKSPFGYSGLRTTIIDYTLSRATTTTTNNNDDSIIYDPMKVLSTFTKPGATPEEKYQFGTYRRMHRHALSVEKLSRKEDPSSENRKRDKWERFMPRTNAMWLECLLYTLLYRSKEMMLEGSNDVSEVLQRRLYEGLKRTLRILDGSEEGREGLPMSAKDLLEVAKMEGLLSDDDIKAVRESLHAEA